MSESHAPLEKLKKELADCKADYEVTKDERDDYRRQRNALAEKLKNMENELKPTKSPALYLQRIDRRHDAINYDCNTAPTC